MRSQTALSLGLMAFSACLRHSSALSRHLSGEFTLFLPDGLEHRGAGAVVVWSPTPTGLALPAPIRRPNNAKCKVPVLTNGSIKPAMALSEIRHQRD